MIVGSVTAMEPGTGEALVFRGGTFGEFTLWPTPTPAPAPTPTQKAEDR
ncbi:hypothetical protein [Sinomonas mesophila]|nr:hypothetical protein [Sinomonas mesophila]